MKEIQKYEQYDRSSNHVLDFFSKTEKLFVTFSVKRKNYQKILK